MSIVEILNKKIIEEMKSKNPDKLPINTLKVLKSEIQTYLIDNENNEANIINVVNKEIAKIKKAISDPKIKDKIEFIEEGKRKIEVMERILPKIEMYTEEELISIISLAITETNSQYKKDMKKVMNFIKNDVKVDKSKASKLLQEMLI